MGFGRWSVKTIIFYKFRQNPSSPPVNLLKHRCSGRLLNGKGLSNPSLTPPVHLRTTPPEFGHKMKELQEGLGRATGEVEQTPPVPQSLYLSAF